MAEFENLKKMIMVYSVFTIILLTFGITAGTQIIKPIPIPETISFDLIFKGFNLVIQLANFLLSLLIYSVEGQVMLNYLLWGYRVILFIEIIRFIKK